MYSIKKIIDDTIKLFNDASILRCCYLEKKLNSELEDIHLYLILKDKNFTFRNIVDRINLVSEIEKNVNVYHVKLYDWDKVLHVITEDKVSIYFHIVNNIFNFNDLFVIINNENIEVRTEIDNTLSMVNAMEMFINDLNSSYRTIINKNNYIALGNLYKLYNDMLYFLGNYYLDFNINKDYLHYDFSLVLSKLSKSQINKLNQIINMMKLETINECMKMIVWFFDDYAKNLPISVMQKIDIDYYIFIKELILK